MTHQNHQTNGASLEDCHTNFFALTDLCGIKWRKFLLGERQNASGEPLDDPVLRSYSRCLESDILCVWRRAAAPKQELDPNGTIPFDILNTHTHPPLSLTAAKELWIFWYGEEPNLTGLVETELLKTADSNAQGTWESGLSYECRSLLFKALHNLIERCLLSKDIVRLGKWFVQPCSGNEKIFGKSSHHLSFSFAFFVHGESTVCASMDLREHPAVRPLYPEYLEEAAISYAKNDSKSKSVILAPFGIAATLTGNSYKAIDPVTEKLLNDWCSFYPLCNKENSDLPMIVEVISGGVKMRYPSKYVLVTNIDEAENIVTAKEGLSNQTVANQKSFPLVDVNTNTANMHLPPTAANILSEQVWLDCITSSPVSYAKRTNLNNDASHDRKSCKNNGNSVVSGSEGGFTNDDCIPSLISNNNNTFNNNNNSNSSNPSNLKINWDFVDPTQKIICSCTKNINIRTPIAEASSLSRNPNSIGEIPILSVGSPTSAGQSPHPNSTISQPTSVPTSDQVMSAISPRPPTSVPSIQPQTPVEHGEKNTPVATPIDQHDSKSIIASPYIPTPSVEPPLVEAITSQNLSMKKIESLYGSVGEQRDINSKTSIPGKTNTFVTLKRPLLSTKDYENSTDEDVLRQKILYDYSTWDAWMDHPVKRLKPNEDVKQNFREYRNLNIYDGHIHTTPNALGFGEINHLNEVSLQRVRKTSDEFECTINDACGVLQEHEIKKEPVDEIPKDKNLTGNLYTNEGLQVSYKDLDQIFDNSDGDSNDETIQVHTPPNSNKSSGCLMDDVKKCITTSNPNTSILRPEELSKMFPTPPSHEHHPNSSPCSSGMLDLLIPDIMEGSKIKQEFYPDLGSPTQELIEDWSYAFIPPVICKFVGSSKYAPLPNLPSQSLPPIILSSNSIYKPSWQQTQRQPQDPQYHHHHQHNQHQNIYQQQQQLQLQQQQQLHYSNSGSHIIPNSTNSSSTRLNLLEREKLHTMTHQLQPNMMGNQLSRSPSVSFMNFNPSQHIVQQQIALRTGISPISPAGGATMIPGFSTNSPIIGHINPYKRTPIPPPPPYELAVSSPASSTTSSYLNKQLNLHETATPISSITTTRAPEANSLLVNILLYDTSLNIFRDHNFDSCTLCVCNADGQKCVGNIRGSDSGLYVSLPDCSFNPTVNPGISNSIVNSNMNINSNLRNVSAFGSVESPLCPGNASNINQHQNGYIDDDPIICRCGFSAVVNRRLAHRAGLFYEDEMEITGMAEDPIQYKKKTLLSCILRSTNSNEGNPNTDCNSNDSNITQSVIDLLRDQCTIIQSSCSSIQKAVSRYRKKITPSRLSSLLNILEFTDANDVVCLAIEQGRIAYESSMAVSSRMDLKQYKPHKANISVHKWPFIIAGGTRNNQDIVRMMKSMQPLLQHAFHTKCRPRLWEATYTVKGPLTWRQFHMLAGRGTGQCEPQPIPYIIVGHEKDWLTVAPYAIQYWDKLLLEPYSYTRDVAYLVIAPDNDYVIGRTRTYFKELSTTYEMCKLGRHTPIKGWDGILQVRNKDCNSSLDNFLTDDWLQNLGDINLAEQIKIYAETFQNSLIPYLSRIPNDKSLLDPPEGMSANSSSNNIVNKDRPLPSPMPPLNTSDGSQLGDKTPSTPKCESDQENQRDNINNTSTTSNSPVVEPFKHYDDDINPPVIVIYVVEPFTCGTDSTDLQRIACLSLLRCCSYLLSSIPESIRSCITFQIISMDSILELGRNGPRLRFSDEMRSLALSVFSQCRRFLSHSSNVKSLTGFGTAANMEIFLKNKDEKNKTAYKMYTPPYVLAPMHEKSEKTDNFRLKSVEQQYSVLYCNYCLSEDQCWLLAAATDDRGELLETITINIDIPNRSRRRKAPARRIGLQKLMDFILGIISQTVQPWRLVVGRIGRIGHGELKSWSWLLSKQNLQRASKQLKEICNQCSLIYPHSVPSILSACLVTLEPDSNLRVMSDQFTPDERFSQISMQNPLSTPQDVTCTHILVFPTSAVSQSFQKAFNETHINGLESDDMIFDFGEDPEDPIGDVNSLGEIFDWDQVPMQHASPERNSNHGSPGCMEDTRTHQSPGPGGATFNSMRNSYEASDMEEVGTVLQQPLALGYFVSTAPTGRMPSWFWSSCPHLENVCPVFLKTALHLHVPGIQQTTDDPLAQNSSSANDHPLDSSLTADVLRYVLEGYNVLSWLAMDSNTHDRLSCLPIHVQVLMQLYHLTAAMA